MQLTPDKMPEALAALMNLSSAARFGQHGVQREKFVEQRRQDGDMLYYLLDLLIEPLLLDAR